MGTTTHQPHTLNKPRANPTHNQKGRPKKHTNKTQQQQKTINATLQTHVIQKQAN